ncbi:FAD-binding oxidoreductase [Microbacterium sp. X-17]|uniref:FAD-binding oxidoreductase n=1 Tax=Microbacterium sp. X-17 TaxID=3144404 RepID=UPI0031F5A014
MDADAQTPPGDTAGAAAIAARFARILGEQHVLTPATGDLTPYGRGRGFTPATAPALVLRPGTARELADALGLATETGTTVVARGGGYSVGGYAYPPGDPVAVIDTRRLDRVIGIDRENLTVTAEAGILNGDLTAAVAEAGLRVQTVAVPVRHTTLGGSLSGVVGAGVPARSSVTGGNVQDVAGLLVALPTGALLRTGAGGANVHATTDAFPGLGGPNLTGLFLGDGGVLGIKAEATMCLEPLPPAAGGSAWAFPGEDAAWGALTELMGLVDLPYVSLGVSPRPEWTMLARTEADSPDALTRKLAAIEAVVARWGGILGADEYRAEAIAMGEPGGAWAEVFLEQRREIVAFVSPRTGYRTLFRDLVAYAGARAAELGLADLVSLHPYYAPHGRHAIYTTLSLVADAEPGERAGSLVQLMHDCVRFLTTRGAATEFHQGATSQLAAEGWSDDYRRVIGALRRAFDPAGILNPGVWERHPT